MKFCWLVMILMGIASGGCVNNSRTTQTELSQIRRTQDQMRRQQADQLSRLQDLESQVRGLSGSIEELQRGLRQPAPRVEQFQQSATFDDHGLPPLEALAADQLILRELSPTVSELFGGALQLIREEKYESALPLIDKALRYSYGGEGVPQLMFWKGVVFEGQDKNRDAIAAYDAAVRANPQHPRSALSLLRLAGVFARIGDESTARLTLKKLIADFPQSPEALIAKSKLDE